MDKLARWGAQNRVLAKTLFSAILCACYSMLVVLGVWLWVVVLIDLLVIFFVCVWVDASSEKLMQKPLKALAEFCDPYPLMQETAEQLTYGLSGVTEQAIRINHCLALREIGQYQQCWELLSAINIDRHAGTLPVVKFTYYCNLCDVLTLMGRYPEAEVWYQTAIQIYRDMPENKMKQALREAVEGMAADAWYRRGGYAQARACISACRPEKLNNRVDQALLYARCSIAMGEADAARQSLEFVIAYGNRLYAVTEARYLLDTLNRN